MKNQNTNPRIVSGIRPTGHIHLGNYLWRRS
jgi:tryptophanyl-tRNA synthetase